MSIDTSKQTGYVVVADYATDEIITSKQTAYIVLSPQPDKIYQLVTEVITNITTISTDPLKLCLPFDQTLGESFTVDDSPSVHPMDLSSGGFPTIESGTSKFGGGALEINGTDYIRILLPQPDFNFTGDFTIEFWIFKNVITTEDIMGQWPSTSDKGWRIRFFSSQLHFEHTPDGSTVTTEIIPFDVPTSTWTHLAFENFGGIFTVYANGLAVYNTASFVPLHASNGDLFVGRVESSSPGEHFDGSIDEFRIIVGEAVFKAPFLTPIDSVDCSSVIPPDITWDPGNLGIGDECRFSLFTITVNGIEIVLGTQEFFATGLPSGMSIDTFGNIIGVLPVHDAPPNVMNYTFSVTFLVGGIPLLGPSTWSFDVQNKFNDDVFQVTVPSLFDGEDRTAWKTHLFGLIPNNDIFRVTDPNFGISKNPELFIIDGLTDSPLILFQNAISAYEPANKHYIVIETLKFGTTDDFDVLYYTIADRGSTVLTFPNPLNVANQTQLTPDPIEPISVDNVRDQLVAAIGFDSLFQKEDLPDWLPVSEPLVLAAYVVKGTGQALVDKFNSDAVHHVFKGRIVIIDRLNITRCTTLWPENGETKIIIKFDDV